LQALPSPDPILIDDTKEDAKTVAGAVPTGLNASSYFRGGKKPVTYTAKRIDGEDSDDSLTAADAIHYNLKVDKDSGAITIEKLKEVSDNQNSEWYVIGDSFTITAKDADDFEMPSETIWVKRNRAPQKQDALSGTLQGNAADDPLVVGNQSGMALDTDNKEVDATDDPCDDFNTACVPAAELLAMFENVDGDDLTYTARSKNPSSVSVEVDSDGDLIITGHAPLLDGSAAQNVQIFFKAADGSGLASEEHEAFVRVDPMPVVGALPTAVSVKKAAAITESVIGVITGFITNKDEDNADENVGLTIVAADGTASTQTITTPYFVATIDSDNNLDITTRNVGSDSVVILVEETANGVVQWVKHTVTVTVTAP
jgi:hypothetical protein